MSKRKIAEQWKKRAKELKVAVKVMIGAHQAKYKACEKAKSKMLGAFARRSRSRGITRSTVSTQAPAFPPKSPPPFAKQMPAKRPHEPKFLAVHLPPLARQMPAKRPHD